MLTRQNHFYQGTCTNECRSCNFNVNTFSSLFDLCYRLPVGLTPSSKKEGSGNAINVGTGNIDQLTSTSVTNILLHSWKDEFKFMLQTSGYSKYQHWLLSFRRWG